MDPRQEDPARIIAEIKAGFSAAGLRKVIEAPGRRNWEKSRRISQLVFFNKDVFDYLVQHPDRMISGRNL